METRGVGGGGDSVTGRGVSEAFQNVGYENAHKIRITLVQSRLHRFRTGGQRVMKNKKM